MKKLRIGNIELENNIILAPMAGITNYAYRKLLKEFGCGLVVSEMISDFALIYNNKETLDMLYTTSIEHPLAIQLFGGSKDSILKGAKILLEKADFEILDINLGCPVPKVVKNNAGSSWLLPDRQEELYEMMKELVNMTNKPVTAKIRLGWDESSINVVSTCKTLEKAGVAMIAIHGRTRSQFYSGNANYDSIKKAKEAVKIPIVANGDIDSVEKAKEVLDYTNADGIMIGRGALGNPNLIKQLNAYLTNGEIIDSSNIDEQLLYMKKHFEYLEELKGEYKAVSEMRGLSTHYLKGFSSCKQYKARLSMMKSKEEFLTIINDIKKETNIL